MATISNLLAAVVETGKARDDAQKAIWAAERDINDKRRILHAAVGDYHDALSEHRSAVLRLDAAAEMAEDARKELKAREALDRQAVERAVQEVRS